jgi:AcrR family transcriptional regulator
MINQRGYRGASVNRIAAALNVTKGSFYHHHSAKDDLVFDCFERSYDRLSNVQLAAGEIGGDGWTQIASALAELIDLQFRDPMPLLRTTALQALPSDERVDVVVRSNRLANRFAGMLSDGIADGSVRAVDPLVASQLIMPALNAAYEARGWAARQPEPGLAVKLYAWTLWAGVFGATPEVGGQHHENNEKRPGTTWVPGLYQRLIRRVRTCRAGSRRRSSARRGTSRTGCGRPDTADRRTVPRKCPPGTAC